MARRCRSEHPNRMKDHHDALAHCRLSIDLLVRGLLLPSVPFCIDTFLPLLSEISFLEPKNFAPHLLSYERSELVWVLLNLPIIAVHT